MKGKVSNARVGKTHVPMGKAGGMGSGVNKRDSNTATNTPSGGKTLKYNNGDVTRSTGSLKKYG